MSDYSLFLDRGELKALRNLLEEAPTEPRLLDQIHQKVCAILDTPSTLPPSRPNDTDACKKTGKHGLFLDKDGYCDECGYQALMDE